jgi:lipopolysaccharide/colanic/teichoic acid biosynthesis glycosyltransferase
LTGFGMQKARVESLRAERMAVEREYVENYSLRKDLKILLRTVVTIVNPKGAF